MLKYSAIIFEEILVFSTTNYERKNVAHVRVHASRSRFNGIFNFLCDEEYREERGAQRPLGTLGAEKLKIT